MNEEAKMCAGALRMIADCDQQVCDKCNQVEYYGVLACHTQWKVLKASAFLLESLSEQLEQVTRERDAAVKDIRNAAFCGCHVCKHYYRPDQNAHKYACKIHGSFDEHDFIADDGSIFCGSMEWRGVKVEG